MSLSHDVDPRYRRLLRLRTGAALLAVLCGLTAARPAQAQAFVDAFAGRSAIAGRSATITTDEVRLDDLVVPADVHIDVERLRGTGSSTFGLRAGYWFGAFGIALDAATLDPDVKRQTIRATGNADFDEELFGERITIRQGERVSVDIPLVTVPTTASIAPLAMVRLRRGRWEPYAFAGPAYIVTDKDLSGDWGVRAGAGLKFAVTRSLRLFGEYRFTAVDASVVAGRIKGRTELGEASSGPIDVAARIRHHGVVAGLGIQF